MVTVACSPPEKGAQGGFSLLELMAVLAILGIILAGSIELFDSLVKGQRIRSASFELYSSLSVARSEAMKRGGNVTIAPTDPSDWSKGWIITDAAGTELKSQGPIGAVDFTTTPSPLPTVIFARSGRPTTSPRFEMTVDGGFDRCVRLELSGAPRTSRGACS